MGCGIGSQVVGAFTRTLVFAVYLWVYDHWRLTTLENSVLTWIATFLLIDLHQNDHELKMWKYVLAGAMLGLSLLMISDIRYPSFKKVDWKTRGTLGAIVIAVLVIFFTVQFRYVMPVVLFSLYLIYGMVRPFISQKMRREIEVEAADDTEPLNEPRDS